MLVLFVSIQFEVHFLIHQRITMHVSQLIASYCLIMLLFVLISIFIAEHFSVLHFTEIGSQPNCGRHINGPFSWTFNLGRFLFSEVILFACSSTAAITTYTNSPVTFPFPLNKRLVLLEEM